MNILIKNFLILALILNIEKSYLTSMNDVIQTSSEIETETSDIIEDVSNDLSTQLIDTFNNQFNVYSGSQKGTSIKALIARIYANNDSGQEKVSVMFNNVLYENNDVITIKEYVNNSDIYNVEFQYSTEGYIKTIIIN